MTTLSDAFGVSSVFSLPIDNSSKDSTSDSSKRSRRESESQCEEAVSGHEVEETYSDCLMQDEVLLESYTKIWESFETKDLVSQKVSKSPILSYSSAFYPSRLPIQLSSEIAPQQLNFKFNLQLTNQIYTNNSNTDVSCQYLSDLATWMTKSYTDNRATSGAYSQSFSNIASPWQVLSGGSDEKNQQAPRAKANSFGYQVSPNETPNFKANGKGSQRETNISSSQSSSQYTSPSRLFQFWGKTANPEDQERFKKEWEWEQDTDDSEIMRNINSLLDSGNSFCEITPWRANQIYDSSMRNELLVRVTVLASNQQCISLICLGRRQNFFSLKYESLIQVSKATLTYYDKNTKPGKYEL